MNKVIITALDLNPKLGSESGTAAVILKIISKYYEVELFVDKAHMTDIMEEEYPNVNFHYVEVNRVFRRISGVLGIYNIVNVVFISKVKRDLRKMNLKNISLIHCLTPSGIHSFNDLFVCNKKLLVGPVGGGLPTPRGFECVFKDQYFKNLMREIFYGLIMFHDGWKKYFLNAYMIIVGTEFVKKQLPNEVREKCVTIFDCVVDVSYYVPLEKEPKKKQNNVDILFAANLRSSKGITLLVKAVALCIERGLRGFALKVAGDGPLMDILVQMIKTLNLENHIILLGNLRKHELLLAYQYSDVFCLPTLREPGGTSILEAMACGLPIITSNYGGPADSVSSECGIKIDLVNSDDYVVKLADAIVLLVKNGDMRVAMGMNARERAVKEFSQEAFESKILKIYQKLVVEND